MRKPKPAPAPRKKQVYTPTQAAEHLEVSTTQVLLMIRAGKLPAVDIGLGSRQCLRIPVSAVEDLLTPTTPEKRQPRRRKPAASKWLADAAETKS